MEAKKVILRDAHFTLTHRAVMYIGSTGFSVLDIKLANIDTTRSDDVRDPRNKGATLIGEYLDASGINRDVFVDPGTAEVYYYDEQTEQKDAPHRVYLKRGTSLELTWKKGSIAFFVPTHLDIDEARTLSAENLNHTEVGNDGRAFATVLKDGVEYDVFIDDVAEGEKAFYAYLPLSE